MKDTVEYRELVSLGRKVFIEFLGGDKAAVTSKKFEPDAEFIQHLITSYSENKKLTKWNTLEQDAQKLSNMILFSVWARRLVVISQLPLNINK